MVGRSSHGLKWWRFIFYSYLLGLFIKWIDDATRPSRPNKKKRNDPLLRIIWVRWHNAPSIVANELTHVSVPTKDG
jgi:hypothetical protein